jgi:branched-chain amino acid transport system substrate-binding protein
LPRRNALKLLAYAAATFSRPRLASAGHSSGAQDVLTLGLVTSSEARFGPETGAARTAAEIAVDELNASGGIRGWKVNLATYEDDGDGASTAGIAHRLAGGDRVIGIVSVAAPAAIRAASAALTKFGIPVIETLATDPDITQTGPCIFRNRLLGAVEGRAGAEVAVTRHRAQRIVVLGRDDELGRTTTDAFARHATMRGAAIHAQRIYRTAESDFTAVLRRLPAGYDLIYHASAAEDGARLTRAARALGIEARYTERHGSTRPASSPRRAPRPKAPRSRPRSTGMILNPTSSDSSRSIANGPARSPTWLLPTPTKRRASSSGPPPLNLRAGGGCATA